MKILLLLERNRNFLNLEGEGDGGAKCEGVKADRGIPVSSVSFGSPPYPG
jgi:hypothetical protein